MTDGTDIIIAAKCAPIEELLCDIRAAGIEAVELYLSTEILNKVDDVIRLCLRYPFHYAVHAPNDGFEIVKLAKLADAVGAKTVVFHNIYFDDEWNSIMHTFRGIDAKVCVENVSSVLEPLKIMRRYNVGLCLDMEHLQIECAGVYEEVFIEVVRRASHIHLSGYTFGSDMWHTHIHHSMEHGCYLLDLLKKAGYSGLVISEAKTALQTYKEFKRLRDFVDKWKSKNM